MFNFDKIIERYHTDSVKYDGVYDEFGCGDILPMWVADMDFQAPPAVTEAIREYCDRGVFGYTFRSAEANDAFRDWVKRRYGWDTKQEWLSSSPGIVTALSLAVRAFTQPGERLLKRGRIGLNDGLTFGAEGQGFRRMNIGCPRIVLEEGLARIKKAMS